MNAIILFVVAIVVNSMQICISLTDSLEKSIIQMFYSNKISL